MAEEIKPSELIEPIEVDWAHSFTLSGVRCYLAKYGDEWLIVSTKAPRFCFSAPSEDEVKSIAERGITFWRCIR